MGGGECPSGDRRSLDNGLDIEPDFLLTSSTKIHIKTYQKILLLKLQVFSANKTNRFEIDMSACSSWPYLTPLIIMTSSFNAVI